MLIMDQVDTNPVEKAPDISILNEFCPGRFFEKLLCVNIDKNANNSIAHKTHFTEELFGTPASFQWIIRAP